MHLSVIIPAYNESARIGGSLEQAAQYLERQPYASEIIVVDDGSEDGTAAIARGHERSGPPLSVKVVAYAPNRGKGHAVRMGMRAASGAHRLFFDADASTPIEEVERLWPLFEGGAAIVIGSRAHPESDIQVHQARYREGMGRVFNLMLRGLGITRFKDTQCGFKAFTAEAAEAVFARQRIERYSFDAELLFIAQRLGFAIAETPIVWRNSPESRVNPVTDATRMFLDILRIRLNAFLRRYD